MNPVLYDTVVVFNTDYELNGYNSPVMFMDAADGTIIDYWSDHSDGPFAYSHESMAYEGQYLFLSGQRSVDCINIQTRQTQWHGPVADNGPFIYTSNGYLYRGIEYNGQNPNNHSAAVMRTPLNQMAWDTVYAFDRTDNYKPGFNSMGFGTLANDDEVVVWKNRSFTGSSDRTDIFAYNLTADTLLWRNIDFVESSGIIPLKVDNGVVYGLLQYNAIAIDLASGNTIWSQNFNSVNPTLPMQFSGGDLHIDGDKILVKSASDELVALNTSDGKITWIVQDHPFGFDDRFTYFEGKLFYCAHQLVIADVLTGRQLIEESQVEHLGDVRSRVVIDPIRRVMYMHNGEEALCVRIPDDL
ncbi:outer membrane protein assembly factor BamB family protein [Phaeocystidibacter luteus]|nr:PQQ-binding-like beta-propeller repeat protein [Phaeocystidibacter luteus]